MRSGQNTELGQPSRELRAVGLNDYSAGNSRNRMFPSARWGTFLTASIIFVVYSLIALVSLRTGAPQGLRVFGTFWASGHAAFQHENPYAAYPLTYRPPDNLYYHRALPDLNLSPPALLPLLQVMAIFNPDSAVKVWIVFSVFLWLGGMAVLLVQYGERVQRRQILWFMVGPAAYYMLLLGQDYALFIVFAILVWMLFARDRHVAAGIFLGLLVASKPNLALWPIFLAICGYTRIAKAAAITVFVACIVPVLLYGPGIYVEWLHAASNDPHWIFCSDISLTGFASRLGSRTVGQVLSIILLACTTAYILWKRPSAEAASGVAICLAILASPVAWMNYSLFLAPVLFSRPWSTRLTLALAPLMLWLTFAESEMAISRLANAIAGSVYFVPICILFVYFLRMAASESKASPKTEIKFAPALT